jgi:predicted aldo/keto reductase-like oxidoreductase
MEYRALGRTGLEVSVIGLGTEHLNKRPRSTVVDVIREAADRGVNYYDVVFAFPEYRDNLGAAFSGIRDEVFISGHIGCAITRGYYRMSRDYKENETFFLDLLKRLRTEYVDVLMVQMVNEPEALDDVNRSDGLFDLAERFRHEGKARFIGMSGHKVPAALRAVEEGRIDVLMFPLNIAWDFTPGRKDVFCACKKHDVGLVGMKIYGGGRLFGRKSLHPVTPEQCIHYALAQPGVSTVVPGVKTPAQLRKTLYYLDAPDEERAYKGVIRELREEIVGNCVYCNHCQPCSAEIDIARTFRNLDRAMMEKGAHSSTKERVTFFYPARLRPKNQGRKERGKPSDCIECRNCTERCPFDVDVISKMKEAARILEGKS